MKKASNFVYFALTFLFLLFTDLYFASVISAKVLSGSRFSNALFNIVYTENTGAAFSIMQNSTKFLIVMAIAALILIFLYVLRNLDTIKMKEIFFLSFLASGIAGNTYERIFSGYVRDFFDLAFVNFPIFNISDIFINIGVLGIIILILFTKKPIKFL